MSILFEKMTAIADNIRSLLGLTEKLGLDAMTENLETANTEVESQKNIIEQLRAVISEKAGKPFGGSIDDLIDGSITEVVSNAESVRQYAFYDCKKLTSVKLVNAKKIEQYGFGLCVYLTYADLYSMNTLASRSFYLCYSLKTLIIRSQTICSMASTNALDYSCHFIGQKDATYNPNGDKDGYIYVPKALIEDYKVTTNWVTFASQFRALEDYTVDGTITGELDESKI